MSHETHCAPFVHYPVARSTRLGACLTCVVAINAAVLMAWVVSDAGKNPLYLAIAATLWMLGSASALHFWFRSPTGRLAWSGQSWAMDTWTGLHTVSALDVCLDLQSFLWLQLHRPGMRPQWVWLERSAAPERWLDLRRAVYSRPKPGAPGAPHSAWHSDLQA